ncbi:hypothetical protein AAZX31_04G074100 [Glycine max]
MWALLREQTPVSVIFCAVLPTQHDWSQPTIVDGFEGILYSYGSSNMRRRLYVWA